MIRDSRIVKAGGFYNGQRIINDMIIQRSSDRKKNGFTIFFTDKNKVEASYYYCEDVLDLLKSSNFDQDSLSFQRQKDCIAKNRKEKIKDEFKKYRFFNYAKGFYSLEDLYNDLMPSLSTSMERLKSIHMKLPMKNFRGYYCNAGMCSCVGCDNMLISWNGKIEHDEFMLYLRYLSRKNNTYQETFKELLPK